MAFLRSWLAGLCLALAGSAMAAPPPRIEAFDVERIEALQPGARLNFTVFGTPRAQVQLEIEGARQILPLREADAGVYEGAYVIDAQDRISAGSRVVATLRGSDSSIVRAVLDEPLLLDTATDARPFMPTPAWPPLAEPRTLPPPVSPPVSPPASPSIAPPISPPVTPPVHAQRTAPPSDAAVLPPGCRQCAIVESIRSIEALPSRPPRTVAGNVFGALFGEGVAEHVDRHVNRVNTAVDRAVNGRAQTPLPSTRYEVLLRLPSGQRLTRLYDAPPPFRTGDMLVLPQSAIGQLAQGG